MTDRLGRGPATAAALLLVALLGTGCGTIHMTDTSRSATEQLLLTSAWDSAIGAVDFRPLAGPPVYLDTTNLEGVDTGWMTYRIRESMARQGVRLVDDPEEAVAVVEAGAAVYGTDSTSALLGIPSNGVVGAVAGARGIDMPEVSLAKKTEQYGVSRLAMFARDLESGRIVWESGTIDADSYLKSVSVLGMPMRSGTITHPSDRRRKHLIKRMLGDLFRSGHDHGPRPH